MDTSQSKVEDQFQAIDLGLEKIRTQVNEYMSGENWTAAKSTIESSSIDSTDDLEFMLKVAEVYSKTNDFPAALKTFHNILDKIDEKDPALFDIYKDMGNLYLKCGDIEAAEEKYNLANAIDNQDENLIINYGVLAIQKGQYTDAKQRFAEVINKNDQSDVAWVGLGLVHRAHADHDLARACLLRGLDENPYNKLALSNYYQWCNQDGIDAPDSFLTTFLEKHPEDAEIAKLASGLNQ